MKKILLPLFMLLLVFTANAQSKRSIYYYYKGEKVYYPVSTDRLIVGMNQTMAFAELKFIVANAIGISADSLQEVQDNKQFIIKFGKNKLVDEKPYVTKLLQLQWIQFARPVFLSESGKYNSYGTEFIVKLKSKTKYSAVQTLMESNGCSLVRKYPFQNDMYILSADKKANYDALAMSNLFYESGLFDYAEPNKIVYDALHAGPPNDPLYGS